MDEIWLRTDEREDILASLRMLSNSCDSVRADISAWKWVVIGSHSALQSAFVFHLGFGNDLLLARQEDAAAWVTAHEDGSPYPETMMDSFPNLYKKLKQVDVLGYRFIPRGTQGRSIKRLNQFRNEFVHFMPKGWSIELTGMPTICTDCLDVIGVLDQNSLCMRWESQEQHEEFCEILQQCQSKLQAIRDSYSS